MEPKKHIRADKERKDKVTSVRLSPEQHKKVQKNAQAAGMSISNFFITSAVNGGNALTPALLVEIQDLINYACESVEKNAPEAVATMQEGANKLWQKLT